MLDLVADQLGIPIELGDIVMFAISSDDNYTSRKSCNYYEGKVVEIDDRDLKVGKWNRSIKVLANEHSNQIIYEAEMQAQGRESMGYFRDKADAQESLKKMKREKQEFFSNDVICVTKVKQLAATHYAEFFI